MSSDSERKFYIIDLFNIVGDAPIVTDSTASNVHLFWQRPSTTIEDLKKEIEQKLQYSVSSQRLLYLRANQSQESAFEEAQNMKNKRETAVQNGMSKMALQALDTALKAKAWKVQSSLSPLQSLTDRCTWSSFGYSAPWSSDAETWIVLKQIKKYEPTAECETLADSNVYCSQVSFDDYIRDFKPTEPEVSIPVPDQPQEGENDQDMHDDYDASLEIDYYRGQSVFDEMYNMESFDTGY